MRPRPTKSIQPSRIDGLGDVRQVILQVGVAGADQRHVRHGLFALRGRRRSAARRRRADLPAAGSRRWAEKWRAAACADCSTGCRTTIDRRHARAVQAADQLDRLGQIVRQRIVRVDAEAELVRQQMLVVHRLADLAAGFVRQRVEHAQPHDDLQIGKLDRACAR